MNTIKMPNYRLSDAVKRVSEKVSTFRAKTQVLTARGLREVDDIASSSSTYAVPYERKLRRAVAVEYYHGEKFADEREFYLIPGEGWHALSNNGHLQKAAGFNPNTHSGAWREYISADASQGTGLPKYSPALSEQEIQSREEAGW